MYPDTTTKEGREIRIYQFAKEKLARFKELYSKTGNKKYLHMAEIYFGEGDYLPKDEGIDPVIINPNE